MRTISYVAAFFAVLATLVLNILSVRRPDWLIISNSDVFHSKVTVTYGLAQRCERQVIVVPGLPDGSRLAYTDYQCRPFPSRSLDRCDKENKAFCLIWGTAGYSAELAAGFGAMALLTLLFGVTTHSRRRRIWRAVAALVAFHVALQLITFSIVTHFYLTNAHPDFEWARLGLAYVLNTLSWTFGVFVAVGVVTTGISANRGHRWAAGNRAYRRIEG
ncbi:hypothetical protein OBBRIDRAFT_798878 [Obba rivulosa]|uniref:Uncharacterized protein n=1 Tax=Obba rivulosa TaxID=1052685 RepID=A0A8E2AJT3_9APHY|nr:hypothetical protein OBBRIDRAFT_798878 [Obba rivulosa]